MLSASRAAFPNRQSTLKKRVIGDAGSALPQLKLSLKVF
jgi:hypothetical protein